MISVFNLIFVTKNKPTKKRNFRIKEKTSTLFWPSTQYQEQYWVYKVSVYQKETKDIKKKNLRILHRKKKLKLINESYSVLYGAEIWIINKRKAGKL